MKVMSPKRLKRTKWVSPDRQYANGQERYRLKNTCDRPIEDYEYDFETRKVIETGNEIFG